MAPPLIDLHCSESKRFTDGNGRCFGLLPVDDACDVLIRSGPLAMAERSPMASGFSDPSAREAKAVKSKIDLNMILYLAGSPSTKY